MLTHEESSRKKWKSMFKKMKNHNLNMYIYITVKNNNEKNKNVYFYFSYFSYEKSNVIVYLISYHIE